MSYGRNPHYIYSDGECMNFDCVVKVREEHINALLYKLLLLNRREELAKRLRAGKAEWLNKVHWPDDEPIPSDMPKDHPEYVAAVKWMESQEDDLVKRLMGLPSTNGEGFVPLPQELTSSTDASLIAKEIADTPASYDADKVCRELEEFLKDDDDMPPDEETDRMIAEVCEEDE